MMIGDLPKPEGLFQSKNRTGHIFPVMILAGSSTVLGVTGNHRHLRSAAQLQKVPTFNDCRGENLALEITKQKEFVCWAIDPWTSQVNVALPDDLMDDSLT